MPSESRSPDLDDGKSDRQRLQRWLQNVRPVLTSTDYHDYVVCASYVQRGYAAPANDGHEPTTYQKVTDPSAGTLKRWFLVTNLFKTVLVAIDLRGTILNDPVFQGVGALVTVFMMLAATLRVMPYEKHQSNVLEAKLFGVVR